MNLVTDLSLGVCYGKRGGGGGEEVGTKITAQNLRYPIEFQMSSLLANVLRLYLQLMLSI